VFGVRSFDLSFLSVCAAVHLLCLQHYPPNMQLSTTLLAQPDLIEDEDKSRNIKIATWILLGITVAVFVARQIMKAIVFRTVALDDFFILAATVRKGNKPRQSLLTY
jgi:hypothetical protein